jgi:hypothetical protein
MLSGDKIKYQNTACQNELKRQHKTTAIKE